MSSILVVDDDPSVRCVVTEMLKIEGHKVVSAPDGRGVLGLMSRHDIDLVITDLIMPEKEGLETIADIKRESDLPVIAISGGGKIGPTNYLESARFFGADAVLAKPFARRDLVDTVSSLLS